MTDIIEDLKQEIAELRLQVNDQQKLLKSEAKYRRLLEGLRDEYIIFSHDMDGRYLYVSPSIKSILNVEPSEILGKGWHELFEMPDEALEAGYLSDRICAEGKIPQPFELTVFRKDGKEIIFEVKEWPLFDDEGRVIGNEGIAKDITESKRVEWELRAALKELKTLQGIIPICSNCKNIRDDDGYWEQIEAYFTKHSEASFSHGICPDCVKKLYPDIDLDK